MSTIEEQTPLLASSTPASPNGASANKPEKASFLAFMSRFWLLGLIGFGGPSARTSPPPARVPATLLLPI